MLIRCFLLIFVIKFYALCSTDFLLLLLCFDQVASWQFTFNYKLINYYF